MKKIYTIYGLNGFNALLNNNAEEQSTDIRIRVTKAREIQKERFTTLSIFCNAQLSGKQLEEHTPLSRNAQHTLHKAMKTRSLSARAWSKIRKIARSIADLEESPTIEQPHILEALCYRLPLGGLS